MQVISTFKKQTTVARLQYLCFDMRCGERSRDLRFDERLCESRRRRGLGELVPSLKRKQPIFTSTAFEAFRNEKVLSVIAITLSFCVFHRHSAAGKQKELMNRHSQVMMID